MGAHELLEHRLLVLARDAEAVVRDADPPVALLLALHGEPHPTVAL
jgi:hypothetical protein